MDRTTYTATAKALHWLMAIALIGLFGFGLYMSDLPLSPQKLKFFSWHKWAGVTVLLLAVARLGWRITHRAPALPRHMKRIEKLAAHGAHAALYGLMFAIPLSGWLMSSAKGFQTVLFGVLPIPDLLEKNKALGDLLQNAHWTLNLALAAIVAGHALAAIKHHVLDHDDVLIRMLPGRPDA